MGAAAFVSQYSRRITKGSTLSATTGFVGAAAGLEAVGLLAAGGVSGFRDEPTKNAPKIVAIAASHQGMGNPADGRSEAIKVTSLGSLNNLSRYGGYATRRRSRRTSGQFEKSCITNAMSRERPVVLPITQRDNRGTRHRTTSLGPWSHSRLPQPT